MNNLSNLSNIQNDIKCNLNLEIDPLKISVIDDIKLYNDFFGDRKLFRIMKNHLDLNELSKIDTYIVTKILNPLYEDYLNLRQSYYKNLLLDVYFVLNNPFMYSTVQLKNIYDNKEELTKIPEIINKCLLNVYSNDKLRLFYNEFLFERWVNNLDFKKVEYEKYMKLVQHTSYGNDTTKLKYYYSMYKNVWDCFESIVAKTKATIKIFHEKYKGMRHNAGCYLLSKEYYAYCCELNIGLPIGTEIPINNVLQWGIKEFEKISKLMKVVIDKLEPELKDKSIEESIKIINSMKKYKYTTREEFLLDHKNTIKKYRDYFINQKKLPLLAEPILVDFDEEKMAGGYWALDTFYLNTNRWMDTNKFDTSALVLHETIPGHHLQISYEIHNNNITSLVLWFPFLVNGYAEGWGLFSEKLIPDLDNFKLLGIFSFLLLRTLRIIADISIHYYGMDPKEVMDFFQRYLPMPKESIESEIYRYVSIPGQALCYKLGDEIIRRMFINNFERTDKLLDDDAIDFYDKLIRDGLMPLEILCNKHDVSYNF
jgi:hypothetical protein